MKKGMCQVCGVKEGYKPETFRFVRGHLKAEWQTWELCTKCLDSFKVDKGIELQEKGGE